MKKITLILLTVLLFFPIIGNSSNENSIVTFDVYLKDVLKYYPLLKNEEANIEKAIATKALASASRMPHFFASANFQYGNDPVYVFGALLRQNKFTSSDFQIDKLNSPKARSNMTGAIEGQWLLFDFSQTSNRIKSASLMQESAQYQASYVKMEATMIASEMYSRLALTQLLLQQVEEITNQSSADINFALQLKSKGFELGADFYLARMSHTNLLQLKNELMAQEAALIMAFNVLRGKDAIEPVKIQLDFNKIPSLPGDISEWLLKTVENRLDIKALEKQLQSQGVEIKTQQQSFLPKIMAMAQASENLHSIDQSGGENYMLGLKVSMDVFDPTHGARVKTAKADKDQLLNAYQALKDQAINDTAQAYYQIGSLKNNESLAKQAYEDILKASALTVPLYKEGKRSIADMVSIRRGVIDAYERQLRLAQSYRLMILTLKFYAGQLDEKGALEIYGR